MLVASTVLIMLIVAYAHFREGLFTAATMLINVILAGVLTFNFYEPLADLLALVGQGTFLDGYEDFLVLLVLFVAFLAFFRWATNNLASTQIDFPPLLQQFGAGALGLATGYLASGFLLCALQTLPWHENFLDFQPKTAEESPSRRLLPADRVWLALMRHAGAYAFAREPDNENADSPYDQCATFDRPGSFELRYLRFRRYSDNRKPMPNLGEFQQSLKRTP
jgi:hypothetical protein